MTAFGTAPAGGRVLNVIVADHAIVRARARRHYGDLTRVELAGRIAHEVQQALASKRVSDRIPVWACRFKMRELHGAKAKTIRCRPGSRFVWDEAERYGWIVGSNAAGDVIVRTSMHRVRGEQAAA